MAGEKISKITDVVRSTSFLVFFIALAVFFSLIPTSVESSTLIDKVVHCENDEYLCDCGSYCDNSNAFSAETNNTIDGCADGRYVEKGLPLSDYGEIVYSVRVSNLNLSVDNYFNAKDYVKVDVQLLCSIDADTYYVFYKNSTNNSTPWNLVEMATCTSLSNQSELRNVSTTLQLDDVIGEHAVRVFITYTQSASDPSCGFSHDASYSDTDDIVFSVIQESDFNPPEISIISPASNSVFESSSGDNIIEIIANITDATGVDKAFVNVSYTDNLSLVTLSEFASLENDGSEYFVNVTIPPNFVGFANISFLANDTVYVTLSSFIPNHVNNYTYLLIYFIDTFSVNITKPEAGSFKNASNQTINVTVVENYNVKNYTLKTIDINGALINLNTTSFTVVNENMTIYSLNYTFNEGLNSLTSCIKNMTTTYSIDCISEVFTVDLHSPMISYSLLSQYLNNESMDLTINITDLLSNVTNWSISLVYSNGSVYYETSNTQNQKENLISVPATLTKTGNYTLVVYAFDFAGNRNDSNSTFMVEDLKSPNMSIVYVPSDSQTLDPGIQVNLSINASDEGEILNTVILVYFENTSIILFNQTLVKTSQDFVGNKNVYSYMFNFTPLLQGVYYINISSADDALNLNERRINFSSYYENKYNASFDYNSRQAYLGQTETLNFYRIKNTGDTTINISVSADNTLLTSLSDYLLQLSPSEEKILNVSVDVGQYVNDYTLHVDAFCITDGCLNEDSTSANATDSFNLSVLNDNAFLTAETDIGGTIYDSTTGDYTITLTNIGKANATNITLDIASNTSAISITPNNINITNISGLNWDNEESRGFSIISSGIGEDTKSVITFALTYNDSLEVISRNITKNVTLKPKPATVTTVTTARTVLSSGGSCARIASVNLSCVSESANTNQTTSFSGNLSALSDSATNGLVIENPSVITYFNEIGIDEDNNSAGIVIGEGSGLENKNKELDSNDNMVNMVKGGDDISVKQNNGAGGFGNLLTGKAISDFGFSGILKNDGNIKKVFYVILGSILTFFLIVHFLSRKS